MDSSLKVSAIVAALAAVLSAVIAAFSRVNFGVLVLRALISGLLFGGLIYGAIFVLKRFTPELFSTSTTPENTESDIGNHVNIVLSDENKNESPSPTIEPQTPSVDASPLSTNGAQGSINIEKEVASLKDDDTLGLSSSDAPSGNMEIPRPKVTLDELDSLPELDGFSDVFSLQEQTGNEGNDNSSNISSPSKSVYSPSNSGGTGGMDPVALAKAIQTQMRKDQKG